MNRLDSKRVSQKLEGVYSYYWEELVCELCKDPLALSKNFISFHYLTLIDNIAVNNKKKSFYLLNFK